MATPAPRDVAEWMYIRIVNYIGGDGQGQLNRPTWVQGWPADFTELDIDDVLTKSQNTLAQAESTFDRKEDRQAKKYYAEASEKVNDNMNAAMVTWWNSQITPPDQPVTTHSVPLRQVHFKNYANREKFIEIVNNLMKIAKHGTAFVDQQATANNDTD